MSSPSAPTTTSLVRQPIPAAMSPLRLLFPDRLHCRPRQTKVLTPHRPSALPPTVGRNGSGKSNFFKGACPRMIPNSRRPPPKKTSACSHTRSLLSDVS